MSGRLALSLLALSACVGPPRRPAPPPARPELARAVEAAAALQVPGPEHASLARLVGDWEVTVEVAPGETLGGGTARIHETHGGRFVRFDLELELAGEPTTLTGWFGYDRVGEHYQALWLSNLATGMALLRGRGVLDDGGILLYGASAAARGRTRLLLREDGVLEVSSSGVGPDGEEKLLRRSRYVRAAR